MNKLPTKLNLSYISARLMALLLLSFLLFSTNSWSIGKAEQQQLDNFAQKILGKKQKAVGYPVNQQTDLGDFYTWYVKNKLYNVSMNNVGNPRNVSPYSMNTHAYENEVVDYFAKLYGFKESAYWGFVTDSGTDGNNHGVYFGRKYLQAKSKDAPILYVSEQAHYSIKKLADVQNTELRLIKATDMGQMDIEDFAKQLDSTRPALIVIAMGTTFKGAIDDQAAIRKVLQANLKKVPFYIHLDAALFGGYLPYLSGEAALLVSHQVQQFDSIAVSGHKFFGFDEPLGIFISTQETFNNLNPFKVPYLNDAVPTITCSRSALGALKFWWKIHSTTPQQFQNQAQTILQQADYLVHELTKKGIKAWKNPYSNTVFFERPSQQIIEKYDLAPDESPVFGKLAHIVVMQHINKQLLDSFVHDIKQWKAQ